MRESPQYKWFLESLRPDQLADYRQRSINQQKDWYISWLERHYRPENKDRKVYEFRLEVDYGTGLMLVAADSEERAKDIASKQDSYGGWWDCFGAVPQTYCECIGVIVSDYYRE